MDQCEVTYTCEGCVTTFDGTPEEAFNIGWDTPERFMSHCTCPNCLITTTVWWKLVVMKQEPTDEDIQLLLSYNKIWAEANGEELPA